MAKEDVIEGGYPDNKIAEKSDFHRAFFLGLNGMALGSLVWIFIGFAWSILAPLGAMAIMWGILKFMDRNNPKRSFLKLIITIFQTVLSIILGSYLFTGVYSIIYLNVPINLQLPEYMLLSMITNSTFLIDSLTYGSIGIFFLSVSYLTGMFAKM